MSAITAEMETELESELAQEAASEFEMEAPAQELEYEGELEGEFETEFEGENEAEMEQESFFNHLAAMADRGGRSQALRRIGLAAARQALRSYQKAPPSVEGESELESEGELESEAMLELEAGANPLQAAHANAIMEHLSHQAASAESESEAAEQFLPLIPLAAKLVLPMAAKLGAKVLPHLAKKVAPHLTRGVAKVARTLFRSKATRPLLRTMPSIAKKTMATLTRHAARGHHVTPKTALRTLARHTARTLSHPRHAVAAFRRSKALDRRYHVAARRLVGRPVHHGVARRHPIRWSRHARHPGYYRAGYRGPLRRHPRYFRAGYRAPLARRHPLYYRAGYGTPVSTHHLGPRPVVRYRRPGVPVAPHVPVAQAAPCQCFQPVSCAACHTTPCPTCHK
jgi:hypothetical protein